MHVFCLELNHTCMKWILYVVPSKTYTAYYLIIIATLPNWAQYNRQQQSHFSEHHIVNCAINIKEPKLSIKRVLGLLYCLSLVLKKVYFSNMLRTPKTKMFFLWLPFI